MQNNRESGFYNPRVFVAFVLCFGAALLALMAIAAPSPPAGTSQSPALAPKVISSTLNGVSPAVRDLPAASPTTRDFEVELPSIKAPHEVSATFVDQALQKTLGSFAMPATNVNFEGMNQSEGCGGCLPPDTTGAVGPSQYVQMVNSAFS